VEPSTTPSSSLSIPVSRVKEGAGGKWRLCRIGAPAGWLGESGSGLPQSKTLGRVGDRLLANAPTGG
jgi:hypothetical protein